MESACSLSSTHRIVLFGRIFPPGIIFFSVAVRRRVLRIFQGWVLLGSKTVRHLRRGSKGCKVNRNANTVENFYSRSHFTQSRPPPAHAAGCSGFTRIGTFLFYAMP